MASVSPHFSHSVLFCTDPRHPAAGEGCGATGLDGCRQEQGPRELGAQVGTGSTAIGTADTTESQNHRMVGVGRDLCGSSSPTPLPEQGRLQQAISVNELRLNRETSLRFLYMSELLTAKAASL